MKGVVLIEGCDGTGKTTLARALCDKFRGHYVHLGYIPGAYAMFDLERRALVNASLLAENQLVVIDRHWPSENVYATTMRQSTELGVHTRMMDRAFLRLCAPGILCLAESPDINEERHKKNATEREELYKSILEPARRYHKLWHGDESEKEDDYVGSLIRRGGLRRRSDWLAYDFAKESQENLLAQLSELMARLRRRQIKLTAGNRNWLGNAGLAKWVLVGAEENRARWPFFEFGETGLFLSRALHAQDTNEQYFCFTNALSGLHELRSALNKNPSLKVIALGETATLKLRKAGLEFKYTEDPKMAKRFYGADAIRRFSMNLQEALL